MFNIEMRQLEYFVAAASAGSYARAAKQLFVSPQAVSKGVQVLEGRIGVALFERGPNGIALTPFGETFYDEACSVMESLERLGNTVEEHRQKSTLSFSVGIHSLCFKEHGGTIDWNDFLKFHEECREVHSSFREMRGDSIIASVTEGSLDFGISVPPSENSELFEGIVLKRFPMAALVSSKNEHFVEHDTIALKELSQGELVLFSEEHEFNTCFIREAEKENLQLNVSSIQIRTDSDIEFAVNKWLYAVRPYQHASRTTKGDSVRILPILDAQNQLIDHPLHLFWKKGREITPSEEVFIEMVSGLYR